MILPSMALTLSWLRLAVAVHSYCYWHLLVLDCDPYLLSLLLLASDVMPI